MRRALPHSSSGGSSVKRCILVALLFAGLLAPSAARAVEYPAADGYVTDTANILDPHIEDYLETLLKAFDEKTTAQVAVATVPSTKPENIDMYANKLFEKWAVGSAGKDNGALLVIAKNDRRLRIENGYGLEGAITDIEAKHIIDDVITPQFKMNNFNDGVVEGVHAIVDQAGEDYGVTRDSLGVARVNTLQPIPEDATKLSWKEYLAVGGLIFFLLFIIIISLVTMKKGGKGKYKYRSSSSGRSGGSSPFRGGRSGGGGASGSW
jgi:uncharacterized protein